MWLPGRFSIGQLLQCTEPSTVPHIWLDGLRLHGLLHPLEGEPPANPPSRVQLPRGPSAPLGCRVGPQAGRAGICQGRGLETSNRDIMDAVRPPVNGPTDPPCAPRASTRLIVRMESLSVACRAANLVGSTFHGLSSCSQVESPVIGCRPVQLLAHSASSSVFPLLRGSCRSSAKLVCSLPDI